MAVLSGELQAGEYFLKEQNMVKYIADLRQNAKEERLPRRPDGGIDWEAVDKLPDHKLARHEEEIENQAVLFCCKICKRVLPDSDTGVCIACEDRDNSVTDCHLE